MVTATEFSELALAFEGTEAGSHMKHPDFRANGRIFATIHPGDERAMVKLTPSQQTASLATHGDSLEPASGAWGKQGCTMVQLADVDRDAVTALLADAWQNAMAAPTPRAKSKKPK